MPSPVADVVFWIAVACCAVAELAIVRAVFAARGGSGPAIGGGARRIPRVPEMLWAILPAIALGAVLALTWRAMHPRGAGDHSHPGAAAAPAQGTAT